MLFRSVSLGQMTQLLRPPEVFWTEKRKIEGEVAQEERGGVRVEGTTSLVLSHLVLSYSLGPPGL